MSLYIAANSWRRLWLILWMYRPGPPQACPVSAALHTQDYCFWSINIFTDTDRQWGGSKQNSTLGSKNIMSIFSLFEDFHKDNLASISVTFYLTFLFVLCIYFKVKANSHFDTYSGEMKSLLSPVCTAHRDIPWSFAPRGPGLEVLLISAVHTTHWMLLLLFVTVQYLREREPVWSLGLFSEKILFLYLCLFAHAS